jgi:predicted enzyme related to lactoylglutathione lyase
MAVRLYTVVIDARDPRALGEFWAEALGWQILAEDDDQDDEEVIVGANEQAYPGLCILRVREPKAIKNRLHLDLVPDDVDDKEAEIERLISLSATRVDIGQGADVSWVVLADPEGNEFCVLRPHQSLVDSRSRGSAVHE